MSPVLGDRICRSSESVEAQVDRINRLDNERLDDLGVGYIRAVFPGEAELVGIPEMLGVMVEVDDNGELYRIPLLNWSYLVDNYEANGIEAPFSAADLCGVLGVSLVELGVIGAVA